MMSEKITLTVEQDERISYFIKNYAKDSLLNSCVKGFVSPDNKCLSDIGVDQMARILYEPNSYEVEVVKPIRVEIGDWVAKINGEKFLGLNKKFAKVCSMEDTHMFVVDGHGFYTHDFVRHATKEEIMWAELGREVGEFVEGDVVVFADDSSCRIEPMYPHTMISIKGKHKKGEVKGFYPANSFIEFP